MDDLFYFEISWFIVITSRTYHVAINASKYNKANAERTRGKGTCHACTHPNVMRADVASELLKVTVTCLIKVSKEKLDQTHRETFLETSNPFSAHHRFSPSTSNKGHPLCGNQATCRTKTTLLLLARSIYTLGIG
jgi:hypothetical protein